MNNILKPGVKIRLKSLNELVESKILVKEEIGQYYDYLLYEGKYKDDLAFFGKEVTLNRIVDYDSCHVSFFDDSGNLFYFRYADIMPLIKHDDQLVDIYRDVVKFNRVLKSHGFPALSPDDVVVNIILSNHVNYSIANTIDVNCGVSDEFILIEVCFKKNAGLTRFDIYIDTDDCEERLYIDDLTLIINKMRQIKYDYQRIFTPIQYEDEIFI